MDIYYTSECNGGEAREADLFCIRAAEGGRDDMEAKGTPTRLKSILQSYTN